MKVSCEWLRIKGKKERLIVNRKPNWCPKYLKLSAEKWHDLMPPQIPAPFSVCKGTLKDTYKPQLDGISLFHLQPKEGQSV